ncbi:hypothetical protein DFR24_3244 [Panacagrimonas perspica]|uniref:Uncharacterized protein n=1 Tax=Panacagrimonas perspica TaxID=381431 RepID=A0A4R7P4Y8_9GAMM|nr:hypothetical protein [Panacagrimonas perspica]TDU28864.1 hypothetical protein DFR24_3244 [Panacagrimonas perspica]THD02307.1 hypothetical protein B1810_15385 [Panacagrimonas perspica]
MISVDEDSEFRRIFDISLDRVVVVSELPARATPEWHAMGYAHNLSYSPIGRFSADTIRKVAELEKKLIDELPPNSGDEISGSELEVEFADECPSKVPELDLGCCAVTLALAAYGCVPIASCNGGAFVHDHHEDHPIVAFYCTRAQFKALDPVLEGFEVGLSGSDPVVLCAKDVREFVNVAEAILATL